MNNFLSGRIIAALSQQKNTGPTFIDAVLVFLLLNFNKHLFVGKSSLSRKNFEPPKRCREKKIYARYCFHNIFGVHSFP